MSVLLLCSCNKVTLTWLLDSFQPLFACVLNVFKMKNYKHRSIITDEVSLIFENEDREVIRTKQQ